MNFILNTAFAPATESFADFLARCGACFTDITLIDILDILILAGFFFGALRFISRHKSVAVLLGYFACLVVYLASYFLGFVGVSGLLSSVFRYSGVLLAVLFQPEIREVFEKIGGSMLHGIAHLGQRKSDDQVMMSVIDNVCAAVKELSASKTGALIVLSKDTRPDDIVATGVALNADVSSLLLRNLFFNMSPLHDGAVVIDGGKIAAAGCLLPLTRRLDVDANLGTRHRAAIGMSEISDSVTVVVSEETGVISVTYDCSLSRNYTPQSLKNFLIKKFVKTEVVTK